MSPDQPPATTPCPACDTGVSHAPLYRQHGLPVQSCLMPASAEEAGKIARRDLELLQCPECGLVFNRHFDPSTQIFSPGYEETQGFSPTFRRFAQDLAKQLEQRWSLNGKTVVEVGCGKGEFLALLCEHGQCHGIGIDPAHDPRRRPESASKRVVYEQRYFDRGDIGLKADYLVCRHTLEHIGPVGEFLATVHEVCQAGGIREVFFEVPEAARIFDEGAFWDIYYEHTNYFDPTALEQAFARSGFVTTGIEWLFDDQYLGIYARPVTDPPDAPPAPRIFSGQGLDNTTRQWTERIDQADGQVVIWGSGSKGVAFLHAVDPQGRVTAAVDINPYRQGRFMPGTGQPIIAPENLKSLQPALVIIMNPIYREEISAMLDDLGLSPDIACV